MSVVFPVSRKPSLAGALFNHSRKAPQKLPYTGLYKSRDGTLFVPTEGMWAVHEQSKPGQVMCRAGLAGSEWHNWRDNYFKLHPWLRGWLYNVKPQPPQGSGDSLVPSPAMLAFRKAAACRAIAEAAE